jgi:hypothetical protein
MKIDVRTQGLSASQVHEMTTVIRTAFLEVSHRVERVVVFVATLPDKRHAARNCMVEVHMADGHVEFVEERQRRLGAALRRAVLRAWRRAVRWIAQQFPHREVMHLPRQAGSVRLEPGRAQR